MDADHIDAAVRDVLARHGRLAQPAADLRPDADLFALGLDSQAVVAVMLAIEERLDFEFPESRMTRATFASIGAIIAAIGPEAA